MISFDETTGLTTLECDALGCKKSHSLVSTVGDQGRMAMNSLFATMMQDGWYTEIKGKEDTIKHYCPNCGVGMEGVQQLVQRKLPVGSAGMSSVISAQELRQAKTADEAMKIRKARRLDEERGTPGLSEMDDAGKKHLLDMISKGRKIFDG